MIFIALYGFRQAMREIGVLAIRFGMPSIRRR